MLKQLIRGGNMRKAANRRRIRRQKFFAKLAQENPERFEREWSKRVDSWAGLIWSSSKDRVFFTEEEYQELLKKYPFAKEVLESVSVGLYNGVHIYLNALNYFKEELNNEVISEILSHAKRGTLIGEPIFSIVDHAKKTLVNCGEKAVELQLHETTELLNNECCRALAPHIGHEIYSINQNWEPKHLIPRKKRANCG